MVKVTKVEGAYMASMWLMTIGIEIKASMTSTNWSGMTRSILVVDRAWDRSSTVRILAMAWDGSSTVRIVNRACSAGTVWIKCAVEW